MNPSIKPAPAHVRAAPILPDASLPHNRLASIRAIDPAALAPAAIAQADAMASAERVEVVLPLANAAAASAALH